MGGGLEKHVNCDLKKEGSWGEGGNQGGGMKSRKAIPGEGNGMCKMPEAERSGKRWKLGVAEVQLTRTHTAWNLSENSPLDSKVPEHHVDTLGRERGQGARTDTLFRRSLCCCVEATDYTSPCRKSEKGRQ